MADSRGTNLCATFQPFLAQRYQYAFLAFSLRPPYVFPPTQARSDRTVKRNAIPLYANLP